MRVFSLIIFTLICFLGNAQQRPSGLPSVNSPNSYYKLLGTQDTMKMFVATDTFSARYPTMIYHNNGNLYFSKGNGAFWQLVGSGASSGGLRKVYAAYGLLNVNDSTLKADSATLANYFLRIKDSTIKYVTPSQLRDSLATRMNGSDTFTQNVHIYTPLGWGQYPQNSDIPAIGKTMQQVVIDVFDVTIPPTYYQPTAGVSGSPSSGNYEIGSSFSVTLSSSFTQNDAGALTSTVYYKNGSAISGNIAAFSNITTTQTLYVAKSYAQGTCKTNNKGTIDCTGRINAGAVNSGSLTYNVFPTYYYGFVTNISPSDAEVRAAGNSFLSTSRTLSGSLPAPSTSSYIIFAYPSSFGTATITVGGLGITFNLTQRVLVNASGNSQLYNIYISPNPTSGAVPSFTVN